MKETGFNLEEMVKSIKAHYKEMEYWWPTQKRNGEIIHLKDLEGKEITLNEAATVATFNTFAVKLENGIKANLETDIKATVDDILKWGGINKREGEKDAFWNAIKNNLSESEMINLGKTRIAGWSKILAAYKPGTYFIYDSRVARVLREYTKYLWNVPRGQNRKAQNGVDIPTCYKHYRDLLEKLAKDKDVIQNYKQFCKKHPDAAQAYKDTFEPIFHENYEHYAIMAHLEKMLFMMGGDID